MSLSLPAQISSKAAVAALRSLQAKLNEIERDRQRDSERYQNEVRQLKIELDDVRYQLQQQTTKNTELIRDFEKASAEADNLRCALLDCQETIRHLREQIAEGAQQTQHLHDELTTFRPTPKATVPTPDVNFTLDDVEQVCVKAIDGARRHHTSRDDSRPVTLQEIERACDRAVRRMQSADRKTQLETDQLLTAVASATDPPARLLIERCDKLERLLLLYAKFMLKARFRQRRLRPAMTSPTMARPWLPGAFRAPTDRVSQLDRAVRRMTSQCSALIDQIDTETTVDGHERILDVLAQLDRTQAQLTSISR